MTFGRALACIIGLVIVLCLGFAVIGFDTKVTFLLASIVVGIFLVAYGFKLDQVMTWYADGGRSSVDLILILMSVGTVIGTWMASGAVPTIVYYGLKMLTPTSFMIIGFLLCCIVSFFIGSSYSTLASSRAISRPIPVPAPVTTATFFMITSFTIIIFYPILSYVQTPCQQLPP